MTKEQERARARRRWERQQANLARRESARARRMRLAAIVTVVLVVLGVAGVLGLVYADDPEPEAPTTTATTRRSSSRRPCGRLAPAASWRRSTRARP